MIILDEPISPGTPSEFVAAAVVLELSSTFEEQIHIHYVTWLEESIFTRSC